MHSTENKVKTLDEIPSITLLALCYLCFWVLTVHADQIGLWLAALLLVPTLVLHSSLQHEFLHGHPTRNQTFNDFLVSPPIGLFVPYLRFKDTHLDHHFDPNLTDPYEDPESNFLDPKVWNTLPAWSKVLHNFNNTLFGRMLIGPAIGMTRFYHSDLIALAKRNPRILVSYLHHGVGLSLLLVYMNQFATLPIWPLVVASYAAMSVLKIRTFLEHKAHERAAARTVIIDDKGPLALLFLNNNYHSVHHSHPKLVWHKLPAKFHERQDEFLRRNDGYWYASYMSVFRSYFFKRKDPVPHPLMDGFKLDGSGGDGSNASMKPSGVGQ